MSTCCCTVEFANSCCFRCLIKTWIVLLATKGKPCISHWLTFGLCCCSNVLRDSCEHAMVRHEAAEALGAIADPECLQLLTTFCQDPDAIVADSCVVRPSSLSKLSALLACYSSDSFAIACLDSQLHDLQLHRRGPSAMLHSCLLHLKLSCHVLDCQTPSILSICSSCLHCSRGYAAGWLHAEELLPLTSSSYWAFTNTEITFLSAKIMVKHVCVWTRPRAPYVQLFAAYVQS